MKKILQPQDQVFWYLLRDEVFPCKQDMHADVVIVGGGMAGLAAAQAWNKRGKKVIVLEQYYCGSGATGKSSGFVTSQAELSLTDFIDRYNSDTAHMIWDFFLSGVQDIKNNILKHGFMCDYTPDNTLILANSLSAMKELEIEFCNYIKYGYQSVLYDADSIREQISSRAYFGGVAHEGTFGIDGYLYCQEMKKHLQGLGVLIFEETPVIEIQEHKVFTPYATITADYIIICTDKFMPELGMLSDDVYHAQTFVMASQILSDEQVKNIFPDKNFMCWDTDFIYNYFRITGQNRLLVGGGDFLSAYASQENHNYAPIIKKLTNYISVKFPQLKVQFEQVWPGLIGISKDIAPIAGRDKNNPYIYYICAAAGLPIAAALGRYSVENLIDGVTELDVYFSPYRNFPISGIMQSIIGKKMSFIVSNLMKKNVP